MILKQLGIIIFLLFFLISCSNDRLEFTEQSIPATLDISKLKNYRYWGVKADYTTPKNEMRRLFVHIPQGKSIENGIYPQGSIIVKEVRKKPSLDSLDRYQIMFKKGGGYNNPGGGWEWILADGKDISKFNSVGAADILIGGKSCYGCHYNSKDWVIGKYTY